MEKSKNYKKSKCVVCGIKFKPWRYDQICCKYECSRKKSQKEAYDKRKLKANLKCPIK